MTPLVLVAAVGAGAVGALARYLVSTLLAGRGRLPWAVAAVNVVGSFVAGLALGSPLDPGLQLIVLSGFCGGLTTFSTLSVETVQLVLDGRSRAAALSVSLNLLLGISAVIAGVGLARLGA
ncbi:fluoride efflux transporter FluC [Microcella sp.]|uniref:fluoride efflux transporter FluC n=1 Tax=Microcella sp. TaxID=1913979 RepID=UPI003F70A824